MNQSTIDLKYLILGWLSAVLFRKKRVPLRELTTFCCFVGHGRSGGTLVGSLLNAHPNTVISNEFHAFRLLRKGLNERQLCRLIYLSSERQVRRGSVGGGGYTYAVAGQAQGAHSKLLIIGARKAGATAREILDFPDVLGVVDRKITLQKKFVHVSRHPLDCIATTFKKTPPGRGESPKAHLRREVELYFRRCESVERVREQFGPSRLFIVHLEELIESPSSQLLEICEYLGVECSDDYLEACSSIVKRKPNESRWSIEWGEDLKTEVEEKMHRFPWLSRYLTS